MSNKQKQKWEKKIGNDGGNPNWQSSGWKKKRNSRAQGIRDGFRLRSPNLSSNPHLSNPSDIWIIRQIIVTTWWNQFDGNDLCEEIKTKTVKNRY